MNKKILMVLTSHGEMGTTGEKTGIWLEEFASPYYTFADNGVELTLASPSGGQPPVDPRSSIPEMQTDSTRRFEKDAALQNKFKTTIPLADVKIEEYDAIFFPGGHGPMWDLSSSSETAKLVSAFYQAGKPVGAVCHGPAALVQAVDGKGISIVKGKKVTGFANTEEKAAGLDKVVPFLLEDRLRELGGEYSRGKDWAPYIVEDGLLITGQNPASAEATAAAMVKLLSKKK